MDNTQLQKSLLETRTKYAELIKKELLGPGSEHSYPDEEHELITEQPERRYSIGILFPQNNLINAENDDSLKAEGIEEDEETDEESSDGNDTVERERKHFINSPEEDNLDEEINLASQNMPSSMGITFFVRGSANRINCSVSFATYRRARIGDCSSFLPENVGDDYELPPQAKRFICLDENRIIRLTDKIKLKDIREFKESDALLDSDVWIYQTLYTLENQINKGFVREPHTAELTILFEEKGYVDDNTEIDGTTLNLTALKRKINDDVYSVTLMLVNSASGKSNGQNCIFNPQITIDTKDNSFSFVDYSSINSDYYGDEEELFLAMQYRNKKVYSVGMGTSPQWEIENNGSGRLYNSFFPMTEVPTMEFIIPSRYDVPNQSMSIKSLSDLGNNTKTENIINLKAFTAAYAKWIAELSEKANSIEDKFKEIAGISVERCKKSLYRMKNGIKILEDNNNAWDAFMLANRAMFMQRVQLRIQEKLADNANFPGDPLIRQEIENQNFYDANDEFYWRPFQIAFLLMSVESITDEKCEDRNLVDLIWFPTGGGKTEAYLGLTAFTIFYRRLTHLSESDGSAVIMRYTLRLLASQQFTRASTLICACELIRRESEKRRSIYPRYNLGEIPITIGLWIGNAHTPGTLEEAKSYLKELNSITANNLKYTKEKNNKFQVLKCPWCGAKLTKEEIDGHIKGQWGYRITDRSPRFYLACTHESCPFNVELPIQIVDSELYRNPPSLLFSTVDKFAMLPWKKEVGAFFGRNNNNRTPELIIQDELHLISGPLGTMVGLYETVIDALCSEKGVKPKVVASTATIRRAAEQCSALYNREVAQFPSPGIDSDDSFFAREKEIDYDRGNYGRLYIGLMPAGKTRAMMEDKTISALLQVLHMMDLPYEVKDKFWTLTSYFNSLKQLGKCATLVDDEIRDFIIRIARHHNKWYNIRRIYKADELTSRISTTELNETLEKLEKLTYSEKNIEEKKYASSVLLATNMISVGIDVARLNVMHMVGQPKLTSEYIQATSRVGRSYPGVVFVQYDSTNSRDRSHYEQFKAYHDSFYRYVEPTGATPFSKPARDRALHAIAVAFLRLTIPEIADENLAGHFNAEEFSDSIDKLKSYIKGRNSGIISRSNNGMTDDSSEIENEIEDFLAKWEEIANSWGDNLYYGNKFFINPPEENEKRLLKVFNSNSDDHVAYDTMTSMRSVDNSIATNILIWGETS